MSNQVKIKRLSLGLTQQEVADACGISLRTYLRVEHGEYPDSASADRVRKFLFNAEPVDLGDPDEEVYLNVRVPRRLRTRARVAAVRKRMSMKEFITSLVESMEDQQ